MVTLFNSIKALVVSILTAGVYTLYTSTNRFQEQLAREGVEVGKIEALLHYSTLTDIWYRMQFDWLHLFVICLISCLLLLFWLKSSDKSIISWRCQWFDLKTQTLLIIFSVRSQYRMPVLRIFTTVTIAANNSLTIHTVKLTLQTVCNIEIYSEL